MTLANGIGNPIPSSELVHRLRLLADAGGYLTRERTGIIIHAADRIEDLQERIDIMTESEPLPPGATDFPSGGDEA